MHSLHFALLLLGFLASSLAAPVESATGTFERGLIGSALAALLPKVNLNTSEPLLSFLANNKTASKLTQSDTIARIKDLNANYPWWDSSNATSKRAGLPSPFETSLTALAALDVQPLGIPNNQAVLDPDDPAVPATLRMSANNYQLQAAYAQTSACIGKYGIKGCGTACRLLPDDVQVTYIGGTGELDPQLYVAITPSQKLVTISYMGTNSSSIPSVLNSLLFIPFPLAPEFRPNNLTANTKLTALSVGSLAHIGFQTTALRTYRNVLSAVRSALAGPAQGYDVLVTGHSLGAAVAQLVAVALRNNLTQAEAPRLRVTAFSPPRVGNAIYAQYVDALLGDNQLQFTNQHDPVPHLSPSLALASAPSNEMFFSSDDPSSMSFCPGRDNQNCMSGHAGNVYKNHLGPFFGITFGAGNCLL